jgi:hypothetical protein
MVCYPMVMTLCIKPNLSREKNKRDAIYKRLFYNWSRAVGLWWVYVSQDGWQGRPQVLDGGIMEKFACQS